MLVRQICAQAVDRDEFTPWVDLTATEPRHQLSSSIFRTLPRAAGRQDRPCKSQGVLLWRFMFHHKVELVRWCESNDHRAGLIYAMGGDERSVETLDVRAGDTSWTSRGQMPEIRNCGVAVWVGGKCGVPFSMHHARRYQAKFTLLEGIRFL